MNADIEQAVRLRREIITGQYSLPEAEMEKMEALFWRIETFADACTDRADFEQKFLASPLNKAYYDFFNEIVPFIKKPDSVPGKGEYARLVAEGHIKSTVEHHLEVEARSAFYRLMPESIQKWMDYGVYNVPILGDIVSAFDNAGQLKRFLGLAKTVRKP